MKTGKLRPLAIASAKRSATVPDLATMSEAGVPASRRRRGLPCSHPQYAANVINKLNADIVKAFMRPSFAIA